MPEKRLFAVKMAAEDHGLRCGRDKVGQEKQFDRPSRASSLENRPFMDGNYLGDMATSSGCHQYKARCIKYESLNITPDVS